MKSILTRLSFSALLLLLVSGLALAGTPVEKPFAKLSNKELVKLHWKCLNETEDVEKASDIQDEIVNRKAIKETVELLRKRGTGSIFGGWYYDMFQNLRSPETDKLLKPLANRKHDDLNYFANKYFAEVGEKFALENLNANYRESGSSREWAETVMFFGTFKYYPAKKNLVDSIDVADLSLAGASVESLMLLYPETREKVKGLGIHDTVKFYKEYIKTH